MILVLDPPRTQPLGSEAGEPTQPHGPEATAPINVPLASFRQAMLQSERIRVIGLILVLSFLFVVVAIRALFGGVADQIHLLPRFTALLLASAAYESLMLGLVSRAIQRRSDLPLWVWSVNTGIEASIPKPSSSCSRKARSWGPPGPGRPGDTRLLHLHHPLDLAASTKPLLSGPAWRRRSDSPP